MTAKYSPGPWLVVEDDSAPCGISIEQDSDFHQGPALIADINTTGEAMDEEIAAANAELIAAAPELLAALEALLPLMEVAFNAEGDTFGVHHNDANDAVIAAANAIAKAKCERVNT